MRKRLREYTEETEKALSEIAGKDLSEEDLRSFREEMLVQISFFQHERLIHLLVTILFALLAVVSFIACVLSGWTMGTGLPVLLILFLVLLVPYIFHYYFLENGVQHLYELYDKTKRESALHTDDSVII